MKTKISFPGLIFLSCFLVPFLNKAQENNLQQGTATANDVQWSDESFLESNGKIRACRMLQ